MLNDLHLALLLLAGALLVLLFIYNKWQERRMLRRLGETLRGDVGDPLMQAAATPRPVAAPPPAGAPAPARAAAEAAEAPPARAAAVEITDLPLAALYGGRIEPRFGTPPGTPQVAAEATGDGPGGATGTAPRWVEDPLLDWVLELRCAHAVDGVAVFDAAAPLSRMESALPVFLVAWDARSQQWVEPDRFGFYGELLVATQLANRRHRIDEIAASRFIATVQQLAVALDADFDVPDATRVVGMAAELDRLCARFDVQIGMTLHAPAGPWDALRVAQAAQAAGLSPVEPNRWERLTAEGEAVFALTAEALPSDRLSLELDVPLAPVAADPLRSLFKAADTLAIELGARVIDDNGRPVNAASLAGVAERLEQLYAEMRAAGIEPGSTRARRLYG